MEWWAIALMLGYGCGSVPFGWLLGRLAGVDIRTRGSGNIGATNLYRQCGWRYGVPALLLDAAKGVVAVVAIAPATGTSPVACGLAAILGHTFPVWFKFRGGKGVATSAGVAGALFPIPLLIALAVFAGVLAVTRYVSLGSMCAAVALAVAAYALADDPFGADRAGMIFAGVVAVLVVVLHRGNIRRLWAGTENRFSFRRAPESTPSPTESSPVPASPDTPSL